LQSDVLIITFLCPACTKDLFALKNKRCFEHALGKDCGIEGTFYGTVASSQYTNTGQRNHILFTIMRTDIIAVNSFLTYRVIILFNK
jgi:hypothetical protein